MKRENIKEKPSIAMKKVPKNLGEKAYNTLSVILEEVRSNFQIFGESQSTIIEKLNSITHEVGSIKEEITLIKWRLDSLEERMTSIEKEIVQIKIDIKEIKNKLTQKADIELLLIQEERIKKLETAKNY